VVALQRTPQVEVPQPRPAVVELVPVPVVKVKDPPLDPVVNADPVPPVREPLPAVKTRVTRTSPTKKAPTVEQLEARVDRLRAEYGRLNAGRPDASVEKLLSSYKLQTYGAETVEQRLGLEAKLIEFEKRVLMPLRRGP
jgi:hypothetical protein